MSLSPGTPTTIQHKYKEKSLALPSCDHTCVLLPVFVCLFTITAICSTMRRRDTLCLLFPSVGMFGRNNNKHNLCAYLICTFFFSFSFFDGGSLAPCSCNVSFNTWQTMNVRSFAGWCCIRSRIPLDMHHQVCSIFWTIVVSVSWKESLGVRQKMYGSVSACFLNLAICPLVPITFLLPDLSAEQIILIHMAEYCLQCCLQGIWSTGDLFVQTVGSQWSTHSEVIKLGSGNPRVPQGSARGSVKIKLNVKKNIFRAHS